MKIDDKSDPVPGGMADISQLLRRQAAELSRLSQQLSGSADSEPDEPSAGDRKFNSDKPPVQTWPVPAKAEAEGESHLPILASDPALSADSLPVLDAFRQFLEEERRRTRRRMIRLMMGGALIVLGIMGVVAWGFSRSIRQTRQDLRFNQVKAAQQMAAQEAQVGQVSQTASNLERRLSLERQKVQSVAVTATNLQKIMEVEKQRNDQTQGQMSGIIQDQQEEIQNLKEMITSMEIDNALLMGSMKELQGEGDAAEIEPSEAVAFPPDEIKLPDGAWVTPLPVRPDEPRPPSELLPGARLPVRLPNP